MDLVAFGAVGGLQSLPTTEDKGNQFFVRVRAN
jgi:hypothetical protein